MHRLVEGRELWLCGIKLEHTLGLLDTATRMWRYTHSAMRYSVPALRDIGYHFPDTDPRYKGADSKLLLAEVCRIMTDKGYAIGTWTSLSAPNVRKSIPTSKRCAKNSPIYSDARSATSPSSDYDRKLGFTGREEGISAYATVLLRSRNN